MLREMLRDFSGLRFAPRNPLKSLEAGAGNDPAYADLQSGAQIAASL